jgi:hypothetical protein
MFTYYTPLLFLFLYGLVCPILASSVGTLSSLLPVPTGSALVSTGNAPVPDHRSWRNHTIYFHVIMADGTGMEGSTGYVNDSVLQNQVKFSKHLDLCIITNTIPPGCRIE